MKVVVIGNCTVDLVFRVPRFPQPGETVLADGRMVDVGGKGSNQAVAASRCGVETVFLAAVGGDADGDTIRHRLAAESLQLDHLMTVPVPTDVSVIYVVPSGENQIVSAHRATDTVTPEDADRVLGRIDAGDVLLMQGNLPLELTRHSLAQGRRRGARTVLNPAPIKYGYDSLWPVVDYAIPNEIELRDLGGDGDPLVGGRALLAGGAGLVVATLGGRGAVLVSPDGARDVPAQRIDAVDTTGAGDVLCGVFAAGLALGLDPDDAARVAVRAASLSVTRPGTQSSFPSEAELSDIFDAAAGGGTRSTHTDRARAFE